MATSVHAETIRQDGRSFSEPAGRHTGKGEANEDKLRERYDSVIAQYQDDKTTFRVNVAGKINEVIRKLEEVEREVSSLPFDAVLIQIEAVSMALRNSHQILEKGMEIMNDMKEKEKIKEMARKLTSDKDV